MYLHKTVHSFVLLKMSMVVMLTIFVPRTICVFSPPTNFARYLLVIKKKGFWFCLKKRIKAKDRLKL